MALRRLPVPPDNSITTAKLADDAVTPPKINNAPRAAIAAPTGGLTADAEGRTAINAIRVALQELGLINP